MLAHNTLNLALFTLNLGKITFILALITLNLGKITFILPFTKNNKAKLEANKPFTRNNIGDTGGNPRGSKGVLAFNIADSPETGKTHSLPVVFLPVLGCHA